MATSVLEGDLVSRPAVPAWARSLALDATIPAVLFASAAIIVGLHWDIAWHRAIGRLNAHKRRKSSSGRFIRSHRIPGGTLVPGFRCHA